MMDSLFVSLPGYPGGGCVGGDHIPFFGTTFTSGLSGGCCLLSESGDSGGEGEGREDEGWAAAMVGESAAPLPGTARGLTVWPSQDKCLKQMTQDSF